jgi:signal transduction histidine kinase
MVVNVGGFRQADRLEAWAYWLHRLHHRELLTPLRMSLIYVVFGFGSLYVSDVLLVQSLSDPLLSQVQALKGGVEVVLTAGLIFGLTRRYQSQLEQTTQQLERQREELSVLHRVFRHNLRNDLNIILGYANELREGKGLPPECERILATVERMLGYTEHAKHINHVTEENGQRQTFDLAELVPELLDEQPLVTDAIDVTTTIPGEAEIHANRMFPDALQELITNAIKHNDSQCCALSISVASDQGPPWMTELRIEDNGPGIPDGELEPLNDHTEGGLVHLSGMGLWFVYWAIERFDGEIEFVTPEDGGTTIRIRIPNRDIVPFKRY